MAQTTTHTNQRQNNPNNSQSIHPVIFKLLESRGMDREQIVEFFNNNLTQLPDLTQMHDMQKTADRIISAIENNEQIGIYGDYDVDGTTSCALFYHFFKMVSVEVELFQPSRFVEGYGIHPPSIEAAMAKNVDLLITVDCGITNCEAADYAKERGLDLIITDHHTDAAETMPDAYAVVNPNRRDEEEANPLRALAGVGVAFAVCLAVKNTWEKQGKTIPSIYPLLQFVAIGTICDLAKLTPMNIKLTRHGLRQIPNTQYEGIKAFFSPEEREQVTIPSERIGFFVGPMINSKGRLEHPEQALKLLIADNRNDAYQYFSELEISNNERKFITKEDFENAKKMIVKEMEGENLLSSIVYSPDFHEGVVGIVASRLVETFYAPALVFTDAEEEGVIKASCRSAGELNLFELLNECKDLFIKFGGHKAAAGLSMPKDNFKEFKQRMNDKLKAIPEIIRTKQDHFDLAIDFNEVDLSLIKALEMLEPFGMNNSKPIFRMKNVRVADYKVLKDAHVKWTFESTKTPGKKLFGISFNYINKWGELDPAELINEQDTNGLTIQFTLGLNRFNGNEYIQLMVEKVFLGEKA